jgi:hypothetical protein
MTQDTFTDLRAIVDQIIEAYDAERVDPAAIAAEAMAKLNEAELRYAGDLYMRQLARASCRRKFGRDGADGADEGEGDNPNQGELFPEEPERFRVLQKCYPGAARSEGKERMYIRRDVMAGEDVAYNCGRLRGEGNTKLAHATVLQSWWEWREEKKKSEPNKSEPPKAEPLSPAA